MYIQLGSTLVPDVKKTKQNKKNIYTRYKKPKFIDILDAVSSTQAHLQTNLICQQIKTLYFLKRIFTNLYVSS